MKKRLLLETLAILIAVCNVYSQPDCDVQVSFDNQPLHTFGAGYGNIVGDIIFNESGIDVRIDSMLLFGGTRTYTYVDIQAEDCGFGFDQIARFNNASLIFDLSSITTDGLSFIFWDQGGEENLQVNGSTVHVISKFENLPLMVAPNVMCFVDSIYEDNCYGTEIGRLTLIGNINELRIAGQELAIDSLCIDEITTVIPEDLACETQVSFDLQPLNTFGAGYGDNAGDIVFTESGIDVKIDSMLWYDGSRGYSFVEIQAEDCGFGFDQIAWFNNASLIFDLNSIATKGVSFIYWDQGGEENLQVNGATEYVITNFKALPSVVAPGITCIADSVYKDDCTGIEIGKVTLFGNINELRIAGQELGVDSLCIDEIAITALEKNPHNQYNILTENHPNPFSISTVISYTIPESGIVSLKIYDMNGREIRELVNEYQTGNQYKIVPFNAESLPSGIYYYKLQVNDLVNIQKMLLVK